MKTKKLLLLASVLAGLSAGVRAAPEILSYSGRITVSGQPFAGQGHFKFALVNRTGQVSYWANDGNFTVAQEPTLAVAATVTDGVYTVPLGDTSLANMQAIPSQVFSDHNDVHLRIWFSATANGPYDLLSPDQPVTSVPYALNGGGGGGTITQTTSVEGGRVLTSGDLVRLVATGPANPSQTLILLEGDEVDVVTYSAGQPARLEYSFGEHTFAIPQTNDGLEILQTLMGPGAVRLTAATGHQTLAVLRVRRTGGRTPTILEGGETNATQSGQGATGPAVVSLPNTRTVVRGGATTLFVSASGKNLNYQWKKDGQSLTNTPDGTAPPAGSSRVAGASGPALTLSDTKAGDSGSYTVVITNPQGGATTSTAVNLLVDTLMKNVPTGAYKLNATPNAAGHEVFLSSYNVDMYEVKQSYWEEVYDWATKNGYDFDNPGMNTDTNGVPQTGDHPIHSVSWYDAVKWANARSEKDGFVPCYYSDANRTQVYRKGVVNVNNFMVKWTASGYRLPTEAEWEIAARGGDVARRYSWGDSPFPSRANYVDTRVGKTSAVGSFPANGLGLHDMQGNLAEWVWDYKEDRTYEYEFKETFPDANGYHDTLVNEQNSTVIFHSDVYGNLQKYSALGPIVSDATQVKTTHGSDRTNWVVKKTLVFDFNSTVTEVRNEIMNVASSGLNTETRCKMKFFYADGTTAESAEQAQYLSSWTAKTYPNQTPEKLVNRVEVWLRQEYDHSSYEAYERKTVVHGYDVTGAATQYLTLDLPQYEERNSTHFRVKVETDREGDDDVWFELVQGGETKTYSNAFFDKLLALPAGIKNPGKLRIYLRKKSASPTSGGTALKAVYWTTSDPKGLWKGSQRAYRGESYYDTVREVRYRNWETPAGQIASNSRRGFRLVQRSAADAGQTAGGGGGPDLELPLLSVGPDTGSQYVVVEAGSSFSETNGQNVKLWNAGSGLSGTATLSLTALDAVDGSLDAKIIRTVRTGSGGSLGVVNPGTSATVQAGLASLVSTSQLDSAYVVSYDVVDNAGNLAATATRRYIVKDTLPPVIQRPTDANVTLTVDCKSTSNPDVNDFADVKSWLVSDYTAVDANNFDPNLTWLIDVNKTDASGNVISGTTYAPGEVFPQTPSDHGPGYKVTIRLTDSSGNVSAPVVRYLKVGDFTAPTFTMMGKSEIHDFFRFAESNGTTTTEPGTGRTVGLVGGVGDNGPLYDSNYTYAAYDFTDPGVYAEDDNVLWALSEGNVDLDGDGLGEGYAIIAVADRSQMETCALGSGIIHVYSALEANGSTLKDLQDAMFAGTFGSVSPSKVPDVLGQDSNTTGGPYAYGDASQTDLANFDMAVLTIEYRVKDRWENLSSIMTRQLYVYESRKYAGTAIYAQPLTNASGGPFEFYYDNGSGGTALSSVRKDTDGDGASDFWEAALGTDRMDPNAKPDLTSPSTFQNLSGLSTPDLTTRLNALPGSSLLKAATGISGFGAVQALP